MFLKYSTSGGVLCDLRFLTSKVTQKEIKKLEVNRAYLVVNNKQVFLEKIKEKNKYFGYIVAKF